VPALPITPNKGGGFSLASLFRAGEDGFLFYPMSDLTRLLQTSVGGSAVAADTDPVGLDLDNHSWGSGTSYAAIVAAQPELVTNGTFATDASSWTATNATIASTAGRGRLTASAAGSLAEQTLSLVVGKTYVITGQMYAISGNNPQVVIRNNADSLNIATVTYAADGVFTPVYFVATETNSKVRIRQSGTASAGQTSDFDNISVKLVPGNHALQATTTMRPLWKANSGKPYLSFDGSDDKLISRFIPTAACTLAIACRFPATDATSRIMIGGGTSTGNKRCFLGKNATDGKPVVGWGSESTNSGFGSDLGATDHVMLMTGDGTSRDLWIDGALVDSRAPTGGPDGTGGGVGLGEYNNGGSPSTLSAGNLYAALALNRRATPVEIAGIISLFKRTYQ